MKTQFYLTVNKSGSVKTYKNPPALAWDEVAILLNLELPNRLFQKPQLQASIVVDEKDVEPTIINVDTQNNIREAIETASGLEVRLSFGEINS